MPETSGTLLICCGAIAREIVAMVEDNGWDHMRVECLPAQLHNTPEKLPEAIRAKIRAGRDRFDDILGRGGGYVLNAVHNIQPEVPPENIIAMYEAGRDHPYAKPRKSA